MPEEIKDTPVTAVEGASTPADVPASASPQVVAEVAAPAEPEFAHQPTLMETAAPAEKTETPAEPVKEQTEAKPATEAEKPVEPPKEAEAAKVEEKPAEPVAEEPKPEPFAFKDFEVPEGIAKDDARFDKLKDVLTKAELDPQTRGQELLNMHAEALREYDQGVVKRQWDNWNKTQDDWRTNWKADPEIGGSGFETTMGVIARMRDRYFPTENDRKELNDFLRTTGAGNHKVFGKLMARVGRDFDEPAPLNATPKPPPDIGVRPGSRKAGVLYDNTRSP